MVQPDPWNTFVNDSSADSINNVQLTTNESQSQSFEDNFQPTSNVDGLPDSKEYLQSLERKLQKLRKNANVVEQLQARREQCMENLLRGNLTLHDSDSENLARLEEDFEESRRRNITRYINPEQAVNSSELVHIINHDHLDKSVEQSENGQEDSDINTGE